MVKVSVRDHNSVEFFEVKFVGVKPRIGMHGILCPGIYSAVEQDCASSRLDEHCGSPNFSEGPEGDETNVASLGEGWAEDSLSHVPQYSTALFALSMKYVPCTRDN